MRIGLVIYGSLETTSGGYLYDRLLVDFLRAHGETVEVFSLPPIAYGFAWTQNFILGLTRRFRDAKLDLLIEDELCHPSLFALNGRLKALCPRVALVHHLKSDENPPSPVSWVVRSLERRFLRSVDGFIFNSQTTRARVQQLVPGGLNGVVARPGGNHLDRGLSHEAIRQRAEKTGPLRLFFAGNVIPRKGLHIVLKAMTRLTPGAFQLRVAGSLDMAPGYAKKIRSFIGRRNLSAQVTLLGSVSGERMAELFADSDLLVLPSYYEGYGIVYLEGQAFGLPALATTAGAAREIVSDGVSGFLVAPGDAGGVAASVEALHQNRQKLMAMSLAAREAFDRHPPWDEGFGIIHGFLRSFARKM